MAGINSRAGTFMSTEEGIYSPHNIDSIVGNYTTKLAQRRQDYIGARIAYKNDSFKFDVTAPAKTFTLMKPEEEAVLSHGEMTIYDTETQELVATVKGEYKPFDLLDDASKLLVQNYTNNKDYNVLNPQERDEVNRYIETGLIANTLTLKPQYKEDYDNAKAQINFPAWDGTLRDGTMTVAGKGYSRAFTPIYSRVNGETFAGKTEREVIMAAVETTSEEGGKLSLNLVGGETIPEELVVRVEPRRR